MLPFARVAGRVAAWALLASPALALQPRQHPGILEGRAWAQTDAQPSLVFYEAGRADVPSEMARFLAEQGGSWEVRWDARNERPHLVQGSGVPLLPGRGNRLNGAPAGLGPGDPVRVEDVERLVRAFMARYPEMFRIAPQSLRLDRERSTSSGPVWFVELRQYQEGVPVAGARAYFRINNGNLVQFGADRIAEVGISVQPALDAADAMARALDTLGASVADVVDTKAAAVLEVRPVLAQGERPGEAYRGLAGRGYDHVLVWRSTVRLRGDGDRYELTVDARTGALLRAEGLDRYLDAKASGGIYPVTSSDAESIKGLPYLAVKNGPTKYTNASGLYDYASGTPASSTLNGQFVQVSDGCGAISLSNPTAGTLAFGKSVGTDCVTPGVGGAGNTHAARNAFYHLTRLDRRAATLLPGNAWIDSKLLVSTNAAGSCNAVWNGTSPVFYRSGSGCTNAGEIASILAHEWGHGLDDNLGGPSTDAATGEALGDTFAFIQTRDACIGRNFHPGVNCPNCGPCTGVRSVSAFSDSGPGVVARASTARDNAGMNCDVYACNLPFHGPLGYEGHCESAIASSANWDLAQSLIGAYGIDSGWGHLETIWYRSLAAAHAAYRVASGGTNCNTAATTDGCLADNWYSAYLVANDDDGNLANGTPDGCRIWSAFDAHGIACGAQPACTGGAAVGSASASAPAPAGPPGAWAAPHP